MKHQKGAYYIYYYDELTHTFYINDLDNLYNNKRASVINQIENIMTKAYKQEQETFIDVVKKNQQKIKPKVYTIYQQHKTNEIIIDKVKLDISIEDNQNLVKFQHPTWENSL